MTSFQTLRTDVSHRVATIWLNRPERLRIARGPA